MYSKRNYLDKNHEELLVKVRELSEKGGVKAQLYSELLDALTINVAREEVLLSPLIEYLKCRGGEHCDIKLGVISDHAYFFSMARDSMQRAMGNIGKLAQELERGVMSGSDEAQTLNELREHLEIDSEFVYPAGMAAKSLLSHDLES